MDFNTLSYKWICDNSGVINANFSELIAENKALKRALRHVSRSARLSSLCIIGLGYVSFELMKKVTELEKKDAAMQLKLNSILREKELEKLDKESEDFMEI